MNDAPAAMIDWIERTIGGRVVACERQPRWRPAWFIDVEREGVTLALYFRGDRGALDHGVYGLEHEHTVLRVLEANDILVPHMYGLCPEPRGLVMERVAGRANLATAQDGDDPPAVLDDYMGWLAKIHRIGTEPFEREGLTRSVGNPAFADLDRWERTYRAQKSRPEPLIEFVLRWLRRNAPMRDVAQSLVVGDSGQFLFEGARVTSIIDLELAFLGDPLHDLACMRLRDLAEPLGDLRRAFAHYERVTGQSIDRRAIDFHTVRFAICTPMSISHVLANPPPDIDLVRYLVWYVQFGRVALEVMADLLGVVLEPRPSFVDEIGRFATGYPMVAAALHDIAPTEPQEQFRLDVARRTNLFLSRVAATGAALEAADLDEAAALLGARPRSWTECDAALEDVISRDDVGSDRDLVQFFHRRHARWQTLLDVGMVGRNYSAQQLPR